MSDSPERAEEQYPNAGYAWYVVGVLALLMYTVREPARRGAKTNAE